MFLLASAIAALNRLLRCSIELAIPFGISYIVKSGRFNPQSMCKKSLFSINVSVLTI